VDDQSGVLEVVLPGAVEEVQLKKIAATTTFTAALRGSLEHGSSGSAEEPGILRRPGQGRVEPPRGLEDPNLPLWTPTDVDSSLLHRRSSWKVNSANYFAC
jgi:hypothetical protein